RQMQLTLRRRDTILEAVRLTTEHFINCHLGEVDWQMVLATLGQATEVSRISIYTVAPDAVASDAVASDAGGPLLQLQHQWQEAEGFPASPDWIVGLMDAMPQWTEALAAGQR